MNLSNNSLYALVDDCIPESVTVLDLSNNVIRRINRNYEIIITSIFS